MDNSSKQIPQNGDSDLKKSKKLKKLFDYPNNPVYLNTKSRHDNKLKYLTDFCTENSLPMSEPEGLIMNLDVSK